MAFRGRGIVGDLSLNEHRQRDSPVATRCAESVILDERIESPVCGAPIVQIRSLEVTDAALIRDFERSLSFETRYPRITSAVKELSARAIDRLTPVDHRRYAALIAVLNTHRADRVVAINEPLMVFAKAHGFTLSRSHDGPTFGSRRAST
jgi:hypothetical protein